MDTITGTNLTNFMVTPLRTSVTNISPINSRYMAFAAYKSRMVYLFDVKYVRPVIQVIEINQQTARWFIMDESMKDWVEIDPSQLWFWTKEWQAKEHEADENLQNGNYEEFDNLDDFLDSL